MQIPGRSVANIFTKAQARSIGKQRSPLNILKADLRLIMHVIQHGFKQLANFTRGVIKHSAESIVEEIMSQTNGAENPHKLLFPLGNMRIDDFDDNAGEPERAAGARLITSSNEDEDGETAQMPPSTVVI